jgi:hypothetical protein
MRRFVAWLVALPLALAGAQLAHAVDYWLVAPSAHERAELLAGTGHSYFSYLPFLVALAGGLVVIGYVWVTGEAHRGYYSVPFDRWPLALLPLATFVLQEHVERYVHDGAFPWQAITEPTFALGFCLQIPFAIAAYIAARLLLRAAEAIGRLLRGRPRTWVVVEVLRPSVADLLATAPTAGGHRPRGPPVLSR